jgi:hypothetical protein
MLHVGHSHALTLQHLLEYLNGLEYQQKGKQVAGKHTDLDVTINCIRQDILATQVTVQDRILEISTNAAVATDQNILASLRNEERIAEQDRQYALALSNGDLVVQNKPTQHKSTLAQVNNAAVGMNDLTGRKTISDGTDNGENSLQSILVSRYSRVAKKCVCCLEEFRGHDTLFTSSCGHEYCRECMKQVFIISIKDEELYPPRCCGKAIPTGIVLRILDDEELKAFRERALEWTVKDRLYCADPTCSTFIPPLCDSKRGWHLSKLSSKNPFDLPFLRTSPG